MAAAAAFHRAACAAQAPLASAFTFGRRREQLLPGGKRASITVPRQEWISFIPVAHLVYIISVSGKQHRQARGNAAAHGRDRAAGSPREGPACCRASHLRPLRQPDDHPLSRPRRERPAHLPLPALRHRQRSSHLRRDPRPYSRRARRLAAYRHSHLAGRRGRPSGLRRTPAQSRRGRRAARLPRRSRSLSRRSVPPSLSRRLLANRLVADSLEADWNTALRALFYAQIAYDKAREQHDGSLSLAQKDGSAGSSPTCPASGGPPRRCASASASPGCCSPMSP